MNENLMLDYIERVLVATYRGAKTLLIMDKFRAHCAEVVLEKWFPGRGSPASLRTYPMLGDPKRARHAWTRDKPCDRGSGDRERRQQQRQRRRRLRPLATGVNTVLRERRRRRRGRRQERQ